MRGGLQNPLYNLLGHHFSQKRAKALCARNELSPKSGLHNYVVIEANTTLDAPIGAHRRERLHRVLRHHGSPPAGRSLPMASTFGSRCLYEYDTICYYAAWRAMAVHATGQPFFIHISADCAWAFCQDRQDGPYSPTTILDQGPNSIFTKTFDHDLQGSFPKHVGLVGSACCQQAAHSCQLFIIHRQKQWLCPCQHLLPANNVRRPGAQARRRHAGMCFHHRACPCPCQLPANSSQLLAGLEVRGADTFEPVKIRNSFNITPTSCTEKKPLQDRLRPG